MRKILKYKKFIAFMLVFTLSFGVVADYKKKEANAFVIESYITYELLYILGFLVLSTGVVALSHEQVVDMGQQVVDRINDNAKLIGQIVFDGTVAVGLKIDSFIKDAVTWVAENLPVEDKLNAVEPVFNGTFYSVSYSYPEIVFDSSDPYTDEKLYHRSHKIMRIKIKSNWFEPQYMSVNGTIGGEKVSNLINEVVITSRTYSDDYDNYKMVDYFYIHNDGRITLEGAQGYPNAVPFGGLENELALNIDSECVDYIENLVIIPYGNPKVKENYNEDNLPVALPWSDSNPGYIPIPVEVPDTVISPDLPLTWDNVKDTVIPLPVDSTDELVIPDVGDYELPVDLPLDNTGDITKGGILGGITDFFSWLWELLKALLMGIWNLLKAILDLLLGLVNVLLTGLKGLSIDLFVPSDTYFSDVFEGFKNDLFNKLDITSYTMLFDTDYAESNIKDITINIFGQTVTIVRFSMFEEFREIVNTLIYAFMFFLLAIYNYNQIYKLIRGTDYVSASATITHMGGGLTQGEQLKVDSINRRLKKL